MIVARYSSSGTHQGDFAGLAASGEQVTLKGIEVDRIADQKIVESWSEIDIASVVRQLSAAGCNVDEDIDQLADQIIGDTEAKLRGKGKLDEDAQREIAGLVGLLPDIRKAERSDLLEIAEVALSALLQDAPNMTPAHSLRVRIQEQLGQEVSTFLGKSPARAVVGGLGAFFYVMILAVPFVLTFIGTSWFSNIDPSKTLGVDPAMFL